MGADQQVVVRSDGPGLLRQLDPGLMVSQPERKGEPWRLFGFRRFKNLIKTPGSMRTAPGRKALLGSTIYTGGTSGKIAIYVRKDSSTFSGNLLVAVRQLRVTGTASATAAGYLIDTTNAQFTPAMVGRVVYDTTGAAYTVITRFITSSKVAVADDVFVATDGYWIAVRSQVVGVAPYIVDASIVLNDNTLFGEMNDDDNVDMQTFQNRGFIVSGANRGAIAYKNSFRQAGLPEAWDNNTLGVDVTLGGDLTGKYKWGLCWEDKDAWRISGPLAIVDSGEDDGFYDISAKRLKLDLATLPTNTVDAWTHYTLYRKKDAWADWYRVTRIAKTASAQAGTTTGTGTNQLIDGGASFDETDIGMTAINGVSGAASLVLDVVDANTLSLEDDIIITGQAYTTEFADSRADGIVMSSNVLIPYRDPPAGYARMFTWRNRAHFYAGYRLDCTANATNGSATITLTGGYSTDEWMIGKTVYLGAAGTVGVTPCTVRYVRSSTQLELESDWAESSVTGGNCIIVGNSNRIAFDFSAFGDAEMTHAFFNIDVVPDDGDLIEYCGVVRDRPVVLKRRHVYVVAMPTVIDPIGDEIPQVHHRSMNLECSDGCVGAWGATQDAHGNLYWFAGDSGIMRYDGNRIANISNQAVRDWFLTLDSDQYANARMVYEPCNDEIVLAGLSLQDGTEDNLAVAVSLKTGGWREIGDFDLAASAIMKVKT